MSDREEGVIVDHRYGHLNVVRRGEPITFNVLAGIAEAAKQLGVPADGAVHRIHVREWAGGPYDTAEISVEWTQPERTRHG
jgi:hypothetical protein